MSLFEGLAHLMASRLEVTKVFAHDYAPGETEPDARVPTSRLILIAAGQLDYWLGGSEITLRRGCMLYVPAWHQRHWVVPAGQTCQMVWCEFVVKSPLPMNVGPHLHVAADPDVERPAIMRLRASDDRATPASLELLRVEGELKAILGRFFARATMLRAAPGAPAGDAIDARLQAAVHWLNQHYADPDVVQEVHRLIDLSPNRARAAFRRATGQTIQQYVTRFRMEAARYCLRHSDMPIKQIAQQVGYADPFYFSRQFRLFWGHSATDERQLPA